MRLPLSFLRIHGGPYHCWQATVASQFLRLMAVAIAIASSEARAADSSELIIEAFDRPDYHGWTVTGTAFGNAPFAVKGDKAFGGVSGGALAWSGQRGGVAAQGQMLSGEIEIARDYLSFLTLGSRDLPGVVGVELLIGDRVMRAASATERKSFMFMDAPEATAKLFWRTWDVREFRGKKARIRINDLSSLGGIGVDQISQSNTPRSVPIDAAWLFQESYRPQFHYTAEAGWLNDPNGLLYYRGAWHLFHQALPPERKVVVWGHATSSDLLHWKHQSIAVDSDNEDSNFSGSGTVDRRNLSGFKNGPDDPILLFYARRPPGEKMVKPPTTAKRMTQDMAYSTDGGKTWKKYARNPILRTEDYRDRDPKVFYHEASKSWIMVLPLSANNADRPKASYGIYRSPDLESWKLIQKLGPDGWFWECADLFELPIDGDPARTKWLLVKGSGDYLLGTFDEQGFHTEAGPIRTKWAGNYYATQTFQDAPNGRRVQIGWMNTGAKTEAVNVYPGMPFNQQLSFPRELRLQSTPEGPRVFRNPVEEISRLVVRTVEIPGGALDARKNPLADIKTDLLDLEMEFKPRDASRVVLSIRGLDVVYDVKKQSLQGLDSVAPLPMNNGSVHLRVLVDRTSVEAFGNRGQSDIALVFFPDPANRAYVLRAEGGEAELTKLTVRELKSAWAD